MDGHNSHYTRAFLEYARKNRIHVLCYPAHTTHVYQGLDVVVFAVLKHCWTEERDRWESGKGEGITKANFITIYGRAHIRALTPDLIRTAFRKTGIWPFNRNVVTDDMMAPSKETSCQSNLPIIPSTPIRILANALQHMATHNETPIETSDGPPSTNTHQELEDIIRQLSETSLSGLVSPTPLTSETRLQHNVTHTISPVKTPHILTSCDHLQTANEVVLLAALREAEAANTALKQRLITLQASNVLNELYCAKLRSQLAHNESKKRSGKNRGKVLGDGLPRLLSGDEFYGRVVEFEEAQKRAVAEKTTRMEERKKHAEVLAEWKKLEDARKTENKARRECYHEALQAWECEKARAKAEKRKFSMKKPILGKLLPVIPRPKVSVMVEDGSDGEEFAFDDDGASYISDE